MNCALWLNRRKIFHADEIPDNLDVGSLRGYFIAGSLVRWLYEHGGENYARRLKKLSVDSPGLNDKIAEIFGSNPLPSKALNGTALPCPKTVGCSFPQASAQLPLFGSLFSGSFGYGSFGSYRFRIFEWEWEWEKALGSYGSFVHGSFGNFLKWQSLIAKYGSYRYGSFGSFGSFGGNGSFVRWEELLEKGGCFPGVRPEELDEYDRIMYECLKICPLNRYGYGIHNI